MNLFLFANFFPYKKAEPFLTNEFSFARKAAKSLSVFTLYGKTEDSIIKEDISLKLFPAVFKNPKDKKQIFLKGIFNCAPFGFHLQEFFNKNVLFTPSKLYWLFTSLCVTRAALASPAYKQLLEEITASEKPVLYFYWGDNLSWLIPYIKKRNPAVKIFMRLHGSDLYENLKSNYAPLRSYIFADADILYTVSINGQNYLQTKYPEYHSKIRVARLGVFDQGINPESYSTFTIVSVSNLVPLKRVYLIFEACLKSGIPLTWHHFGDGPLMNDLIERVKSAPDRLKIELHGSVQNKTIINFYKTQHVDLFINVSTTEGVPVSIMEALSFGIPVVATDVGGTSELVNEYNGTLLSADINPENLTNAIKRFMNYTKEEVQTLRENARKQFLEKASAEKNYKEFYDQISK